MRAEQSSEREVACVATDVLRDVYDAVIIGGGSAGLSAALVLGRSCRSVLICDDGRPRNAVAQHMHGFLSRDGTPPADLLSIARDDLKRYPSVTLLETHIEEARGESTHFRVRDSNGAWYTGRRLLLATGVYDSLPQIAGLRERWGTSVFVCPYCDGWEVRERRLAVIGTGRKAVEVAQELHQWSKDLFVCTMQTDDVTEAQRRWLASVRVLVRSSNITAITDSGNGRQSIIFDDGAAEVCDAVFLSAPLRQRYPLVDMLGCRVRADGEIEVDTRGRTSVPGCYAAGDAVTSIHQVVLAAASGVCAAMGMNEDLLAQEVEAATRNAS